MTISKKLFLMTAIALNLGSLLNAYYHTNQEIFDFAVTLSKKENNNTKSIARWILQEINQEVDTHNNKNIEHITLIINAPLTLEEKIERLAQLKPGFIKKYVISPTYKTIKNGLAITTVGTAAVTFLTVAPGLMAFSEDMGRWIAKSVIEYIHTLK